MGNISLLDCTLRDGGQGLEYFGLSGINTELFDHNDRYVIPRLAAEAGCEIVELGCMVESEKDTTGYAIYQDVEELSKHMPQRAYKEQLFVGLYTGPDTDLAGIPEHRDNLVDGIRVILRYSELKRSVEFCRTLAQKGYKTFVQPMLTMRYTEDELKYLIEASNKMGAYALYIVDSFGYMEPTDVLNLYEIFDQGLNEDIKIGFHAHQNIQIGMENVKTFLEASKENRDIIVDSCATGMGQGAGNVQTELLVPYLNEKYGKKYNYNCILEICERLTRFRKGDMDTWGYSADRALSAIHKAAYKYVVAMRLKKHMSLPEMNRAFSVMPPELKHRYTPDNLEMVLDLLKESGV